MESDEPSFHLDFEIEHTFEKVHQYDTLNIRRKAPWFQNALVKRMDAFFSQNQELREKEDFANYRMNTSQRLFSAECIVYHGVTMKPIDALMIIDCGMLTFLYKSNNMLVYSPMYLGNCSKLIFSENAQTKCAL